jgi:membrane protein DedA with SNARE-associated domain
VSIVAAAIGEWSYYVLGSLIESAVLAAVVFYAWTWPKDIEQTG